MKWLGHVLMGLFLVLFIAAVLNLLYLNEIVGFLQSLRWRWAVSLASGTWWQSIPGWFLAIAALLAFIIANRQWEQTRKSTNAQIAMGLFKELRDYETIEKLRSIYNIRVDDFKDSQANKKTNDIEKDIDYVLDRFDTLGSLVAKGIVDKGLSIETYAGPPALRCWYQLHIYIRAAQQQRGYFGENFENFVSLSLDHFKKAKIKVWLRKETETIELVTELQKQELHPRSLKEIKKARKNRVKAEKIKREI